MKKKSVIGALLMAAAIVVSVPLGVNRSFARLREDVRDEYYYDDTGYSIWEGIETRTTAAKNLLTVGKRYVDQYPQLDPYLDNLEYVVKQSENSWFDDIQDIGEKIECDRRVGEAAQELAEQLDSVELSEKDAKYPAQLMADMESEQDKLERSSFNDEARSYNARLDDFPVNLLKPAARLQPIETFGGEE